MPTQALEIVNRLETLFSFVLDEVASNEEGLVVVRSDISDAKGALLFVKELEKITDSRFILYEKISLPLVYHKYWICHHAICQKNEETKCGVICKASVEILIKKVDKDTVQEDNFLKLENPLPCTIKLFLVHTHCNKTAETLEMLNIIREDNECLSELKKPVPRSDEVFCHFGMLHELHSEEECTDGMLPTKLGSNSVLGIEAKISKRKPSTSRVLQSVKKQKKEIIPLEDSINVDENFQVMQDHFSYIQLTDHLDQVQKPNSRWTVSFCQDFVICVKWDAAYFNEWKVVVCQDLTAKVFLRDEEVSSLGIKIHSVENLSSLLLAIDELDICGDTKYGNFFGEVCIYHYQMSFFPSNCYIDLHL